MTDIKKFKDNGVVFVDEKSVWIEDSVVIGKGTVIEPNVYLKGDTVIGENVTIGFCTEIVNSKIADNVVIKHSVITDSSIGEGTNVGPFAYIRPNCNVGKNVKIGDFVEDETIKSPVETAAQLILKEKLLAAIDTLTPREQKVIRLRYGLDDSHPRTLEEVGREFNVTRERIRQIEAKALRKLRAPNRSKGLKGFAEGE